MITRIPVVDDTGDGRSGTAITAAWWAQVENMIDARWSQSLLTPTIVLDRRLDYGEADFIFIQNAAAFSITGIAPPANPAKIAKPIRILSIGGAPVTYYHEDGATPDDGRLQMFRSPIVVPLYGCMTFVYGGNVASPRWWLVAAHSVTP